MKYDEYSYEDLLNKALETDEFKDKERLAEWFDNYDKRDWNGECYEIDANCHLYPIYKESAPDEWEIVDYEFRN